MSEVPSQSQRRGAPRVNRSLRIVVGLAVVAGTVLRFLPRRDMWLDEALSANIASLSLTDIPRALRHDGHPPLYYWMLHLWSLAGKSNWWLRALSGFIAMIGLPLAYFAGRRLGRRRGSEGLGAHRVGLLTLTVWAVLPFAVRYATETRMYALVSTLVLAGYLLVDALLAEPRRDDPPQGSPIPAAAGLALVTGALLWTHYWSLWLGAATALLAVVVLIRSSDPVRVRRSIACLLGLAGGLVLFLPWLPTMLYQSQHTGTPWGDTFRPATIVVVSITDFVGGGFGELQIMSYLLVVAIFVAVFGLLRLRTDGEVVQLSGTPQVRILAELGVLLGTFAIGWAVSALSSSTYASRYAAVVAPLFVLCVAGGLAMIRTRRATSVVAALLAVALVVGGLVEVVTDRTQAGVVASEIRTDMAAHRGAGHNEPVVLTCPDQLGPSTDRALERRGGGVDVISFPGDGDPRRVDWADYAERNAKADPAAFVAGVLDRAGPDTDVYAVTNTGYKTLEGKCEAMIDALAAGGAPMEKLIDADADNFFESMDLWVRRAPN